ncbi:transmembrane protein adipocyte-associated 1 homolog isoform X2 [Ctenocephalides felis]|uniref:transmembrane protein adipocyte-associated 1 homolog isoform X2 n=1 Tax=Ctenocephalides felis TaxID=7515 RepID=UPI000E6E56C6|nr:transmembrane protein adipocyte-associated 1 homolog isoform X2 [Ctenocephalides felis]
MTGPINISSNDATTELPPLDQDHFCKLILYLEIANTRVRIWDLIILVPNVIFFIFLLIRFNRARLKLRATSSPIFLAFYGLVWVNILISVLRCTVSMTVNAAAPVGGLADKVLWVMVRFFLLATEMSVVIFGLAFGHLDSHSSIRHVFLATSCISLAFTVTQGVLEIVLPDDSFHIASRDFDLYGHGGMLFWFCSSIVFTALYGAVLILPWTRLRDRLALPIGAGLLNYDVPEGLCIVDVTTGLYFTMYTPFVYLTFLREFFGISQPTVMFSYKAQVDDVMEDDNVSLPHQQSFSSLKTDSDYIYQNNSVYDSTQFDNTTPMNPLYAASLQSPDSITGYSITSSHSLDISGPTQGYQHPFGK